MRCPRCARREAHRVSFCDGIVVPLRVRSNREERPELDMNDSQIDICQNIDIVSGMSRHRPAVRRKFSRNSPRQLVLAEIERAATQEDQRVAKAARAEAAEERRRRGGRPRKAGAISHRPRPEHKVRHPVHITLRFVDGLPNLRANKHFKIARKVIRAAATRFGQMFRIVEYSVQPNHLHIIVEALNARELSRGMQGLGIRLAKNFNLHLRREGALLDHRYHAHYLRTPAEARHALEYVRQNDALHAMREGRWAVWSDDPCSSAPYAERESLPACGSWLLGQARRALAPPWG